MSHLENPDDDGDTVAQLNFVSRDGPGIVPFSLTKMLLSVGSIEMVHHTKWNPALVSTGINGKFLVNMTAVKNKGLQCLFKTYNHESFCAVNPFTTTFPKET